MGSKRGVTKMISRKEMARVQEDRECSEPILRKYQVPVLVPSTLYFLHSEQIYRSGNDVENCRCTRSRAGKSEFRQRPFFEPS
jgi:hypothetical protein